MYNNNERRSIQIQRIYDNSQLDIAVPLNRDRCIPHSTGHCKIQQQSIEVKNLMRKLHENETTTPTTANNIYISKHCRTLLIPHTNRSK